MRIAFFSHWFDPEGGAAAGPGTIARSLRDRGHEVHVVTGYPTYPVGQVFPGYRQRPYEKETRDGVIVHRGPIYPSHDTNARRRAANYLSYSLSGTALAMSRLPRVDAAFVYLTPATAAIPAMALRRCRRTRFIVHVQDLWPDSVVTSGFVEGAQASRAEVILHRYCNAVYRAASTIAVTSPGMEDLLEARGVPREKLAFVPNWADESSFAPKPSNRELARSLGLRDAFTVMYAGNLGEVQSLDTLVNAASLLRDKHDIQFAIVGSGVSEERLKAQVREQHLTNITFVPAQPFERMADILALGDAQVISLKDAPPFRTTLPSKLQANMAAGRPIIAAIAGDAAEIVRRSHAGVTSGPGDPDGLAHAVLHMKSVGHAGRTKYSRNALTYYRDHFAERAAGDRLSELVVKAATAGRQRA